MMSKKNINTMQLHILSFVDDIPGYSKEEAFVRQVWMTYLRHGGTLLDRFMDFLHINLDVFRDAMYVWIDDGNVLGPGQEVMKFLEDELGKKIEDPESAWNYYRKNVAKEGERMFNNIRRNLKRMQRGSVRVVISRDNFSPGLSASRRSRNSQGGRRR